MVVGNTGFRGIGNALVVCEKNLLSRSVAMPRWKIADFVYYCKKVPIAIIGITVLVVLIILRNWCLFKYHSPQVKDDCSREKCSAACPEFSRLLDNHVTLVDGSLETEDGSVYPPSAVRVQDGVVFGCPCNVGKPCIKKCCSLNQFIFKHPKRVFMPYSCSKTNTIGITRSTVPMVYDKANNYSQVKISINHFSVIENDQIGCWFNLNKDAVLLEDGTIWDRNLDEEIHDTEMAYCFEIDSYSSIFLYKFFCFDFPVDEDEEEDNEEEVEENDDEEDDNFMTTEIFMFSDTNTTNMTLGSNNNNDNNTSDNDELDDSDSKDYDSIDSEDDDNDDNFFSLDAVFEIHEVCDIVTVFRLNSLLEYVVTISPMVLHAITFLMFLIVPHLRGGYGKSILSYLAALFFKKFLIYIRRNNIFYVWSNFSCIPFIFIGHFFELSSQAWLAAISYQIWSVFRSDSLHKAFEVKDYRQFVKICALAWGVPAVLTITPLAAELLPKVPVILRPKLGSINSCWFANGIAEVLYRLLPVVSCELASMTMCLAAMRRLRAFQKQSKALHSSKSRSKQIQWSSVFVKLSFISGGNYVLVNVMHILDRLIRLVFHVRDLIPVFIYETLEDIDKIRGVEMFFIFVLKVEVWYYFKTVSFAIRDYVVVELMRWRRTI